MQNPAFSYHRETVNNLFSLLLADAFRKFTNGQGNYKEALVNDAKGMLSLYEASQFRIHGEEILDKALNFTYSQLKLTLPKLSNSFLGKQVSNALKFPIKDGVVRVETRKYISIYEEDESHNDVLLKFAKLDFNLLQRLHKKELCDITRYVIDWQLTRHSPIQMLNFKSLSFVHCVPNILYYHKVH